MQAGPIILLLAFAWGAALGLFYFGGLWWTLKSLPRLSRPRTVFFVSYALRLGVGLSGLGLALKHGLVAFFLSLAAFLGIRLVMSERISRVPLRRSGASQS